MTNNQQEFLKSIIEYLEHENLYDGKNYNIPFMTLPLVEKLEQDDSFMKEIVTNQYTLGHLKNYKFYNETFNELAINIVNINANDITDYKDYYYILRFLETGVYHDYDGELFGSKSIIEIEKCEYLSGHKTEKSDDEIDEYVNNYLKNNSNENIKVKLLEIEKLERNMMELKKEIIKKKLELDNVK